MALLHAYFDASQTQPTGVATIAGYLGSETAWVSVEKQWSENLRTWGLEEFRLSQIMAGRTKVGRENAAACVKSFGRIIGPSDLVSISAGLRSDDWTDAEKTADYSARFPTSYHYCLHMLFGILNEHMELEFAEDRVAIVFDRDVNPDDAIKSIVDQWSDSSGRIASCTIADKRQFPLIQCADLCAGEERKAWIKREYPDHDINGMFHHMHAKRGRGTFWSRRTEKVIAESLVALRKKNDGPPS